MRTDSWLPNFSRRTKRVASKSAITSERVQHRVWDRVNARKEARRSVRHPIASTRGIYGDGLYACFRYILGSYGDTSTQRRSQGGARPFGYDAHSAWLRQWGLEKVQVAVANSRRGGVRDSRKSETSGMSAVGPSSCFYRPSKLPQCFRHAQRAIDSKQGFQSTDSKLG